MWAEIAHVGVDPLSKELEKGCKVRTCLALLGAVILLFMTDSR